mmetsp:Transcript_7591/g.15763  ORF Transcript_7591/g.15763 Transcript_7591/m.15763 type:complete len:531 (-) Transcript_7591:259-1851(-)
MPPDDESIAPPPAAARTIDEYFQSAYDGSSSWRERWRYALILASIGVSSAADAAELFTMGYVLGEKQFQTAVLRGDLARGGAAVAGIANIGLLAGGIAAAAAEGRVGRKATILIGLSVSALGGVTCAASGSVASFASCRFIVGLGIGAILSCNAAIATEQSPPRERGFLVSAINSFWTVGIIGNSVWAYLLFHVFDLSWRIFMLVTTLPTIAGIFLILFLVPESPRFLAVQGSYESAAASANQIASAMGYKGSPLQAAEVSYHYNNHQPPALFAKETEPRSQLVRIKHQVHQAIGNTKKLYRGDLRRSVITVQLLWVLVSVGTSLASWINTIFQEIHLRNRYLNLIFLNCSSVLGSVASALLTDRIGRNAFLTAFLALSGAALAATAALSSDAHAEERTPAIVASIAFYYVGLTGVWTVLYVVVAELFPTDVRATGVVLCSTVGRLAAAGAMFANGALVKSPGALLGAGAAVLTAGAALSWACPPEEMRCRAVRDRSFTVKVWGEGDGVPLDCDSLPLLGSNGTSVDKVM